MALWTGYPVSTDQTKVSESLEEKEEIIIPKIMLKCLAQSDCFERKLSTKFTLSDSVRPALPPFTPKNPQTNTPFPAPLITELPTNLAANPPPPRGTPPTNPLYPPTLLQPNHPLPKLQASRQSFQFTSTSSFAHLPQIRRLPPRLRLRRAPPNGIPNILDPLPPPTLQPLPYLPSA